MSGRRNSLILQERDKKIIALCCGYHFLTQEQIRLLAGFGSPVRANLRLKKLHDTGYLSRRFLPVFRGGAPILYFPGPRAGEVMAEQSGADPLKIRQKRKQLLKIKDTGLPHHLAINEFRLAVSLASKNNPVISLKSWSKQKEMPLDLAGKKFYPDAYFVYGWQGKLYSIFLEVDRSTESNRRFQKEKVGNYMQYGLGGHHQRKTGFQFFRVLIVCKTAARLRNLKRLIEQKTSRMFWLAVQGDIRAEKILTKIWQRPGRNTLFSLLEDG